MNLPKMDFNILTSNTAIEPVGSFIAGSEQSAGIINNFNHAITRLPAINTYTHNIHAASPRSIFKGCFSL